MPLKYLDFTKYITNSKEILNLANTLKSRKISSTLTNITEYLKSLPYTGYKKELFRTRNSLEVLNSGFLTGCTDAGLLFCSLCKSLKIPVRYVETIRSIEKGSQVAGHIFVDIYFTGKWHKYDPLVGPTKDYNVYGKPKIVLKGLDFTCLKKGQKILCLDELEKLKRLVE
ncbi:MAG: transglutaminase domain-containing protein [Candidatus ainarchaeum sp.]|nr:transglutaminase domain-containing protein [Candidatus ainarchaeum sp.]